MKKRATSKLLTSQRAHARARASNVPGLEKKREIDKPPKYLHIRFAEQVIVIVQYYSTVSADEE